MWWNSCSQSGRTGRGFHLKTPIALKKTLFVPSSLRQKAFARTGEDGGNNRLDPIPPLSKWKVRSPGFIGMLFGFVEAVGQGGDGGWGDLQKGSQSSRENSYVGLIVGIILWPKIKSVSSLGYFRQSCLLGVFSPGCTHNIVVLLFWVGSVGLLLEIWKLFSVKKLQTWLVPTCFDWSTLRFHRGFCCFYKATHVKPCKPSLYIAVHFPCLILGVSRFSSKLALSFAVVEQKGLNTVTKNSANNSVPASRVVLFPFCW